jgi:hypothetical protein
VRSLLNLILVATSLIGLCTYAASPTNVSGAPAPPAAGATPVASNVTATGPVGTPALQSSPSEDHLFRMQEEVLRAVEKSSDDTKRFFEIGMEVLGVVGTLVLGIFAFFGLTTANEARKLRGDEERLIRELQTHIAEAKNTREDIANQALAAMTPKLAAMMPKLAEIANYGMTMASFATASWGAMSFEDRIRFCEEAINAIDAAGLGSNADTARSFVLARHGSALMDHGWILEAAEKFKQSCAVNAMKRPDRPYNLACAYLRMAAHVKGTEQARLREQALEQLEECFAVATDGPRANTVSKNYYKYQCLQDPDMFSLRGDPKFIALTQ